MLSFYHAILLYFATHTDAEVARVIDYLKTENEILRSKLPARITIQPAERRRLVRVAAQLGPVLRELVTIVTHATMLRWLRDERKGRVPKPRGRKRTAVEIRELVLNFAETNHWGFGRILGEVKKLGIRSLSKTTVKRILKAEGYPVGPNRGPGSWDEFLKQNAVSLWQCDFLSRRVLTLSGVRDAFVLAFIHVGTRQVVLSPATLKPNDAWVTEQTERFLTEARDRGLEVQTIQHDRDTKFAGGFRACLENAQVTRIRNQFCAPNLNAFIERFIQTIQHECLDHFVIFGERHLNHLCREFLYYYHEDRPHQSLGNQTILKLPQKEESQSVEAMTYDNLICKERLGGLLKSYSRKAA